MATGFALAAGRGTPGGLLVGAAVLTGQLSVGWCNDAVDAARDAAAGRRDKPAATGGAEPRAVAVAAGVAAAACVPLSLASGLLAGLVHLIGVAAAWGYDLGLKGTRLSWLPYAVGFASLPAFVVLGLPGGPRPVWWIVLAGALLGVGAHLANALPDIDDDLAAGVRGWPQRLGARRTRALLGQPLLAATLLLVLAPPGAVTPLGWCCLAAAVTLSTAGVVAGGRRPRVPFAAAIVIAGIDVAVLASHAGVVAVR